MSWRIVSVLVNQNKSYEIFSHISLKLTSTYYVYYIWRNDNDIGVLSSANAYSVVTLQWCCCNVVNFDIFSTRTSYHTTPMKIFFFFAISWIIIIMYIRHIYTYLLWILMKRNKFAYNNIAKNYLPDECI